MSTHPKLDALEARARSHPPIPVAVAYPCDADSLMAALAAAGEGFVVPTLVGPESRVRAVAQAQGVDLSRYTRLDTPDDPAAAARACAQLAAQGGARAIMKGSLHTDDLLAAVVARESGLRTRRRVSHVFFFDIPGQPRPLLLTDGVVNLFPTLEEKRDIVQSAIELARVLGIATPRVAVLSAVETVNPALPNTIDAAALKQMAERGQIVGGIVDGPLALDNAVSEQAARTKGIRSEVAGRPDILLVPNLEAGNMLYKSFVYMAGAECAGVVLGARVPVILTSRAESRRSRIASCALASVYAAARDG